MSRVVSVVNFSQISTIWEVSSTRLKVLETRETVWVIGHGEILLIEKVLATKH